MLAALFAANLATARASADVEASKRAFAEAETAERELRFAAALASYREALAIEPSASFAMRARARADDLAAHAEGAFVPLEALERVRRARQPTGGEVDALAVAAEAFPPGRVRTEARLYCAGALWRRLGQPARAVAPLRAVVRDEAADRISRALALDELVSLERELGDLAGALADVDAAPSVAPAVRLAVHRDARRRRLRAPAIALVGVWSLAGVVALGLSARARGVRGALSATVRPVALVVGAWIALAGAALAWVYDGASMGPFVRLGVAVFAIDVATRALGLARRADTWRVQRALATLVALAAATFLALHESDPAFLDAFGL